MNRAFFIIVTPLAFVVLGYGVVFARAGFAVPWREWIIASVVLLAAGLWAWSRKRLRAAK